jgi:hypothetical protein
LTQRARPIECGRERGTSSRPPALPERRRFPQRRAADFVAPCEPTSPFAATLGRFRGRIGLRTCAHAAFSPRGEARNSGAFGRRNPRTAVARAGFDPAFTAKIIRGVAQGARIPIVAVLVQGVIACVGALAGTGGQLSEGVVVSAWLFYALNAGTVMILRRGAPGRGRAFRVPGFPIIPVIFMALATLLLVNTIWTAPEASSLGLGMTAAGALVYATIRAGHRRSGA